MTSSQIGGLFLAALLGAGVAHYFIDEPRISAARARGDRIFDQAVRHEDCLKELSSADSPRNMREAQSIIDHLTSRADACFHGRW